MIKGLLALSPLAFYLTITVSWVISSSVFAETVQAPLVADAVARFIGTNVDTFGGGGNNRKAGYYSDYVRRSVFEFSLPQGIDSTQIVSAYLNEIHIASGQSTSIEVHGYSADGSIAESDFYEDSNVVATFSSVNLTNNLNVTNFVRSLYESGQPIAGFNFKIPGESAGANRGVDIYGSNGDIPANVITLTLQICDIEGCASGDVVYFSGNGHYYEYVEGVANWTTALAEAATKYYNGIQGHLVTITSQAENDFVANLVTGSTAYIGASDAETNGVWKWIAGPEAGRQFWQDGASGYAVNGSYTNWNADRSEPDSSSSQKYASMPNPTWNDYQGRWGDGQGAVTAAYVVEYSPSSASSFFIFPIENTVINQATALAINALDENDDLLATYSGCVKLSLNYSAKITDTQQVCFSNGVANTSFSVDSSYANAVLTVSDADDPSATGVSNSFSVTNPASVPGALFVKVNLKGVTDIITLSYFNGVTLYIEDENGVITSIHRAVVETFGASSKIYFDGLFEGLSAGKYDVWAVLDAPFSAWRTKTLNNIEIRDATTFHRELDIQEIGKPPLLIIPGFGGSTMKGWGEYDAGIYPRFDKAAAPSANQSDLRVLNGPVLFDAVDLGFDNLASLLEESYTVYTMPWDWRFSVDAKPCTEYSSGTMAGGYNEEACKNTALPYLLDSLQEVKNLSPNYNKVHIVAHSMGGLLTRAYIQSDLYQNDIDKFAMVATPNSGSSVAYYLAQGGDPYATDTIDQSLISKTIKWYSKTTKFLYELYKEGENPFTVINTELPVQVLPWPIPPVVISVPAVQYETPKSHKKIVQFYDDHIGSARELLPTYPFLMEAGASRTLTKKSNTFLEMLNIDNSGLSRMTGAFGAKNKVRTKVFASSNKDTLGYIEVGSVNLEVDPVNSRGTVYPDGKPINDYTTPTYKGDGTVPICSVLMQSSLDCPWSDVSGTLEGVLLGSPEWTFLIKAKGKHPGLMGEFSSEIKAFFDGVN